MNANANAKLIQSVLGLGFGLWLIACGGPGYSVINSEKSKVKTQVTGKLAPVSPSKKNLNAKRQNEAADAKIAFAGKQKKEGIDDWYAESYK